MPSKVTLCLILHVCYLATVKAIPAQPHGHLSLTHLSNRADAESSPHGHSLIPFHVPDLHPIPSSRADANSSPHSQPSLTPLHIPDLAPILKNRADAKFVTVYGLYDNYLHTPPSDTSKPKLAPITEAFMAMTRALATATVTQSGSRTVESSATPTPLHKMNPPPLGPGLVVPPTPVQSSIASTSSDISQDNLEALQLGARLRSHRLVVFGSVIAGVIFLALLLFFLLDPRMMRKFFGKKVDSNLPLSSKKSYRRHPVPAWDTTPISSSDYVFKDDTTEKNFFSKKDPDDVIIEILPKHPTSKFSICSSEYPPSSTSESEAGSDTPKVPVRPPRPPTADSPALSESVYLACADQPYIIIAPQPFMDNDLSLDKSPTAPISQKPLTPREFLDMYAVNPKPTPNNSNINARLVSNTTPKSYDTRHSRTHSAPSFAGPPNDGISDMPEATPVVRRMTKHRRSRSASGWAYPDRPSSKGQHKQPFFSSRR